MDILNHIAFAGRIVKARMAQDFYPLIVSLTVTNRCNLRCFYCYGSYHKRAIGDFPTQFWLTLVDKLHTMGTRLIHIEGGEPLMRDDIGEIIHYIKAKNMICRMNTNGYLVPKKIHDIKKLDSLCISIDGDEVSNDRNRGKGCYQRVIKAIIAAKRHGLSVLTSTTLTQNNIEGGAIAHVISLAEKYGFGAQFNFLYEQTTDISQDPACRVEEEAIKSAVRRIVAYKKNGSPVFYSMATYANVLNWPAPYDVKKFTKDYPIPSGFKHIPCYMGRLMCFVDGDGMVYPCGEHIGTFPSLSILDVGFKKAWENLAAQKECHTCYNTCFNEYNEVFDCKTGVWWNNFKNLFKNRQWKAVM